MAPSESPRSLTTNTEAVSIAAMIPPQDSQNPTPNEAASAFGRLGGSVKSEAKTASCRANAKKGGWPKGKPRGPRKKKEGEKGSGGVEEN